MAHYFANKVISFAALVVLLLGATPSLYCSTVEVTVEVIPSPLIRAKQNARIGVMLEGKPVPGVKVDVWKSSPSPGLFASFVTDGNGMIILPILPSGVYSIGPAPAHNPRYVGGFSVCVIPCNGSLLETTDIVFDNLRSPPRPIDRDQSALSELRMEIGPTIDSTDLNLIRRAQQQPVFGRLPLLRGSVIDQSGAFIPGAWVDVVAKGAEAKRVVLLHADRVGGFSTDLPDGDYILIVSSPGFRTRALEVIVDRSEKPGDLLILLDIGATT